MEVKTLDSNVKSFEANGNKYFISDKISIARFKQYEKLVPRLTLGLDFNQVFANLKVAYESLNKQKFSDASVIIHNIMNGITNIEDEKRVHPALLMASLVINKEGEDTRFYDEAMAMDKINDWQVEGLDMLGFFNLSLNSIQGFKETLLKFTQEQIQVIETEMK
jgi:hypothetical protein